MRPTPVMPVFMMSTSAHINFLQTLDQSRTRRDTFERIWMMKQYFSNQDLQSDLKSIGQCEDGNYRYGRLLSVD